MSDDSTMHPWPENDGLEGASGRGGEREPRGGAEYAEMHLAQRLFLDRISASSVPAEVAKDVAARLAAITDIVSAYPATEHERMDGWRPDLPGRGHALFPPYLVDAESDGRLRGRVTFTRFFLGGNGAAHGGAQPLLFDDVFGRVMNWELPGVARTAFLKVDYRQITPLDVELCFEVSLDSTDGRKRWGSGRLLGPGGELLSEAECLFVQLLPGQP